MRKSFRIGWTAVAAAGLLALGALPAQAATPAATVTPSEGLTDGQEVVVAGTGFTADATATVLECATSATSVACDAAGAQSATTDDAGAFSLNYPVAASFEGVDPLTGASTGTVDCTVAPGCSLIATDTAQQYAAVPISFA